MKLIDNNYNIINVEGFVKINEAKWKLSTILENPDKFGLYPIQNIDTSKHPLKGVRLGWYIKDINHQIKYLNPLIYRYKVTANKAMIEPEGSVLYDRSQEIMKRKTCWYFDGEDYIIYFERIDSGDENPLNTLRANYPNTFKFEEFNIYDEVEPDNILYNYKDENVNIVSSSIDYNGLIAPIINELQKLKAENESLKQRVKSLEAEAEEKVSVFTDILSRLEAIENK